MERSNILLTGGAGFIGSCLARRLIVEGHDVTIVDNLFTGRRENVPAEARFIEGDIGIEETLSKLPSEQYHVVCHLAAQSSGAVSMEQPLYDIQTNAVSTVLLVRWCQQRGVKRFVYASSMGVYGNPSNAHVSEQSVPSPLSYYGISKVTSEYVLRLAAADGMITTALRMFNVYGPGQNLANLRQGMASIYLAYMLKGEAIPITGSLDRFRDFVYIDDVIDAWMNVIRHPGPPSLVYNLGSGSSTTVRQLLELLMDACELPRDYPVQELPAPEGDQFGLYAQTELAARELGWKTCTPLAVGLSRMVAWSKSHLSL